MVFFLSYRAWSEQRIGLDLVLDFLPAEVNIHLTWPLTDTPLPCPSDGENRASFSTQMLSRTIIPNVSFTIQRVEMEEGLSLLISAPSPFARLESWPGQVPDSPSPGCSAWHLGKIWSPLAS